MESRNNKILRLEQSLLSEKLIIHYHKIEQQGWKDASIKNNRRCFLLYLFIFRSLRFFKNKICIIKFPRFTLHHQINHPPRDSLMQVIDL